MRRPIFAAAVIFPITFFCTGLREFFEGIADRARQTAINAENWARPGHGRAQSWSMRGGSRCSEERLSSAWPGRDATCAASPPSASRPSC